MNDRDDLAAWIAGLPVAVQTAVTRAPQQTIRPDATTPSVDATTNPVQDAGAFAETGLHDDSAAPKLLGSTSLAAEVRGDGRALRLGRKLGSGGMGVVASAEQIRLRREVAVKSLKPERQDALAARELVREAWLTGRLEHPNIVPVHDIEFDEHDLPHVVLKRITGVEWEELMDDAEKVRAQFGADDLLVWNLGILLQAINALRFAHSREVIHRDLKPSNVMIGSFGEVYLLDWGLAVSLRDDDVHVPRACEAEGMAGTPLYMAPEMLGTGDVPLSERTDIYVAGAVLFHLVTGHAPHTGASIIEIIGNIALSQPEFPDGTPVELVRICQRAMKADPSQRYQSLSELHYELTTYLEQRGADKIVSRAQSRLVQLRALTQNLDSNRQDVYRLYHETRFGFHEALALAPQLQGAKDGLGHATVAVVDYELLVGQPVAALNLLGDLAQVPDELRTRCNAAADLQQQRQQRLEALSEQMDSSLGARTRLIVGGVSGVLFTSAPLLGAKAPELAAQYKYVILCAGCLVVLIAGLVVWGRESMLRTMFNRRIAALAIFIPIAQIVFWIFFAMRDVPISIALNLAIGMWFAIAGTATFAMESRLAITTAAYLVAFVVSGLHPPALFYAASLSNLVLTLNLLWIWRRGIAPRPARTD